MVDTPHLLAYGSARDPRERPPHYFSWDGLPPSGQSPGHKETTLI